MRGAASLTFTCDGEPFPVAIKIDTADRAFPYIELEHARRTMPAGRERYRIGLQTTPQPFGGVRWWFCCPRTGRRSVRLFLPRGGIRFLSRHAYGLGYATQRECPVDRAWRRGSKLYASMGGQGDWRDDPLPKPKWMRWKTYDRKRAQLDSLYGSYDHAWLAGASRLLSRPMFRKR